MILGRKTQDTIIMQSINLNGGSRTDPVTTSDDKPLVPFPRWRNKSADGY